MSHKIDKRQINWSIQRMRKIVKIWKKLDRIDREYLLSRFMDEQSGIGR